MIRLNVFIKVDERNQADLLGLIKQLVDSAQTEAGCVAYDVFESSTRLDVMMICETWQDNDALIAHTQSNLYKELVPKMHKMAEFKTEKFAF